MKSNNNPIPKEIEIEIYNQTLSIKYLPWTVKRNSRMKTWDCLETAENSDAQDHSNNLTGDDVTSDEVGIQKIPGGSETCNSCNYT